MGKRYYPFPPYCLLLFAPPTYCVRQGCPHANSTAQASSRPGTWNQDNDSHDCSLIIIAAAFVEHLLFARHCAKHVTHIISCKLQDNSVKQGATFISMLQRRKPRPAHRVNKWARSLPRKGWRSSLTPGSLASFPILFTSPHTVCQSHTHTLRKTYGQ